MKLPKYMEASPPREPFTNLAAFTMYAGRVQRGVRILDELRNPEQYHIARFLKAVLKARTPTRVDEEVRWLEATRKELSDE